MGRQPDVSMNRMEKSFSGWWGGNKMLPLYIS